MSLLSSGVGTGAKLLGKVEADDSATVDIDNTVFNGPYTIFSIVVNRMNPSENSRFLRMRLSNDNGSSFFTTGYESVIGISGTGYASDVVTTEIRLVETAFPMGNAANRYWTGVITMYNPLSPTHYTYVSTTHTYARNSPFDAWSCWGSGAYLTTAETHNAVRFDMNSGLISSGQFLIYGVE